MVAAVGWLEKSSFQAPTLLWRLDLLLLEFSLSSQN